MKKVFSFLNSALKVAIGWGLCIVFFGCDNFLDGSDFKEKLNGDIEYARAKSIEVIILPEDGTGSVLPQGKQTVKTGYPFSIEFNQSDAWSFTKWIAVSKDNPEEEITDGVFFADEKSTSTTVKILNDSTLIRIIPKCEDRITVAGEPSPRYDPLGVSRDRSISVTFTKELSESNFIFTEDEIPSSAQTKSDEDGNIWAYVLDGETFFKNISITNIDDYSIAQYFCKPNVSGKLLTVAVDKSNPIKFNSGEIFKTVRVSLSGDIADINGIKMNVQKNWNYQITESTDEKASVNLYCAPTEGTLYLGGTTNDYSLSQKISLDFKESAGYQFIKWDYDPAIIYVEKPDMSTTTATVLEKTPQNSPTVISAVCAPRLRVIGFSPVNDVENPTVSKNSSITISFNMKLPDNYDGYRQLDNISIAVGGTSVKSSFETPVINYNTVTFKANNSNMLDVQEGQSKTVSVTIPSDFYYLLDDGKTRGTYGVNETYDYKIDYTTVNKAEVSFSAPEAAGTFTAPKVLTNRYSAGQEVPLVYELNPGWKFNGWRVMCGTEEVSESIIRIADKSALSTKLIVYDSIQGVTVSADVSEVLAITNKTLLSSETPSDGIYPKDSSIKITFNKPLADECSNMLNKIRISSEGNTLDSCYTDRVLSSDCITIKNTSLISVPKGSSRSISVTVPSDFYYMDGKNKVSLAEETFSFTVNSATNAKAKVVYSIINGETGLSFDENENAGTLPQALQGSSFKNYNIEEEVPVSLNINSEYQFYSWKITDLNENADAKTDQISFKNSDALSIAATVVMNKEGEYKITAVCYKRPSISETNVSPYNQNSATEFAKNESIVLNFNHEIKPETMNSISVSYSAVSNFNKTEYFKTSIDSLNKTVTLTPIKMLPLNNAYETVTVTLPHDKIYYLAQDGKTKITCSETDFSWSYRINNATRTKTIVRFETTEAAVSGRQISVGGAMLSSGTTQVLNVEQSVNLDFPVADGYRFAGWRVASAITGYTVTPSDYVTTGTIYVKNEDKTYLTLSIDGSNPSKAVMKSYDAIGNGVDGYGINILAKDVLLPSVISTTPNESLNSKDSEIMITFNKNLASECSSLLSKIKISMDGSNVDSFFETRILNGNTITIKNTKLLNVAGSTIRTITVTVPPVFYYKDGELKVYLAEEKMFDYKIDASTINKTKLRFYSTESSCKKLNINGTETNNGTIATYNMGESVSLEYPLPSDYKFLGWKVVPYSSSYTVSSSDYITSGSITVTKDGMTYFTLTIDRYDSTKATATFSSGTISGSSYGLSIMTKDTVIPKIVSITPAYKELGVRCDSPIEITFNKEMDKSTLELEKSILIPNPDGSSSPPGYGFARYFDDMSWSGNKLKLKPKNYMYNYHYFTSEGILDITISLLYSRIKDTYGFSLSSENTSYTYRVNMQKETTEPNISSALNIYSDDSKEHSYSTQSYIYWDLGDSEYKYKGWSRNHSNGTFYFEIQGYDDDSGLKKLSIKEELQENSLSTTPKPENLALTEYNLNDLTLINTKTEYGHTYYTYAGTHEMKCNKDGLFSVSFYFTDAAGNEGSKRSLYLIKDTKIDVNAIKFTEFASESAITRRSETTSGDTVSMTLDESSKDVYHGSYETDFDVSVNWGYSDDSITNVAVKNDNKFTFTRDGTKVTFVKITCTDEVNNSREIVKVIPPRPDYDSSCIDYSEKNSAYTGRFFKIAPFSYNSLKTLAAHYDAELEIYMSRQINTSSSYTDIVSWTEDDDRLLEEGKYYYLRPIYVLKYKDGSAWYSSVHASYRTYIKLENDVTSSSSVSSWSITPSSSTASTAPVFPTTVHVNLEYLWNTGLCKVMIDESELDPDWKWEYKLVKYSDPSKVEYFKTPTFYMSCPGLATDGNKHYLYFVGIKKSDSTRYVKTSGITLIEQCINDAHGYGYTNYNNLLWFKNDVNPPSFANAVYHIEPNCIVYTAGPTDDVAMYTKNCKGVLECYLAPNYSDTPTDFDNYTIDELENSSFKKITAEYTSANNIIISLDDTDNGFYTACVVATDSYGNKAVQCFPLLHKHYYSFPYAISMEQDSSVWKLIATTTPANKMGENSTHAFYEYNSSDKWINSSYCTTPGVKQGEKVNNIWVGRVKYNVPSNTSKWLKIVGLRKETTVYASDYTQVDYVYTGNLISPITCNQKNMLQGANGMQVFCDRTTLAHTMYSRNKISETATEDDILKWEMNGIETGLLIRTSTFTYGNENLSDIPTGYYYTIIVHFADGTKCMSEVKQKQ